MKVNEGISNEMKWKFPNKEVWQCCAGKVHSKVNHAGGSTTLTASPGAPTGPIGPEGPWAPWHMKHKTVYNHFEHSYVLLNDFSL